MKNSNDILQARGINEKGFGTIPKLVMQDRRLTIEAKAIYAYFCSYAGTGKTAFPSFAKIIHDLKISKTRFYTHFNLLKEYNYIEVEQEKDGKGKFKRNIYTLIDSLPFPNFPYTGFPFPDNPYTENTDTKINSIKNNNLINNRVSESNPTPPPSTYGEFQTVKLNTTEYSSLLEQYGEATTADYISRLDNHIASTGKRYKSHYATIKKWIAEDAKKPSRPSEGKSIRLIILNDTTLERVFFICINKKRTVSTPLVIN